MPMETLTALPVRLKGMHAGHGEGRNHVLLEFVRGDTVRRLALTEPDARLLMEELGAALHFFRSHAAQTN
jgi:hypothetical protein